jgi:Fe2+ or Zn2+ uptake regulation protein
MKTTEHEESLVSSSLFSNTLSEQKTQKDLSDILATPEQISRALEIIQESRGPITAEEILRIMQQEDAESNKISYTR